VPAGCQAELVVPRDEQVDLKEVPSRPADELQRYLLEEKRGLNLRLKHV
jgi:hypothetical protein